MSTIFQKIIKRQIPADIVFEDDQLLAFNDILPQGPVHILLIPKKEIPTIQDVENSDAPLMGHLVSTIPIIAKQAGLEEKGYRVVINCKEYGGQEVNHLHLHIIGGRKMTWPPG